MHILTANLKHFHQRRGLYLLYVLGGLFTLAFVAALVGQRTGGEGEFAMLLIVAFFIGKMVGVMQMEVASKSFSFSLPGHRGMVRRLVFLAGVVTSLALSLPWIAYPGLTSEGPAVIVLVLASGFSANLIVYLISVAVTVGKTAAFLNGLFFAAIFLVYFEIGVTLERSIVYRPGLVILLAAATAGAVWLWLGRPAWFRECCATPWIGFLDPWDRSQTHKFRQVWARRFAKAPHPGFDRFFLDRIRSHGDSDPRRYIWGTLYTTSSLIEPQWKGLVSLVLIAVIWAGYTPQAAPFVVPVVALMLTGFINPPLYSELPVAGSRKERSVATMAQMLALAGFSTLVVGLSLFVLNRLMPLVPVIEVADLRLSFRPVDFSMLLPLVVVFPLMGIVRVLFHGNPLRLMLGTVLPLGSIMLAAILMKSTPPAYVAATAGILWTVCFLVVYRIAMESDLVRR